MNNFTFKNPTKIIFGKGTIASLATEIPADKRIMITFGGGSVKENGVYAQVKDALSAHFTVEFWGIEPNPEYETLLNAVEVAEQNEIDFLLAVGGGSVLDGTKFIAQAIGFEQEPWNLVRNPHLTRPSLPVASVITLPATGSEMNHRSVISYRAKKEKLAFMSEHLYPLFSILDPEVTYSLPDRQISNGLVDSFMHVMEQYMTYPANALVMDRWAEGILQTLIEISGQVLTNRTDYDVMSNYMICATLALNDFIGMGVPQIGSWTGSGCHISGITQSDEERKKG
jgi:NADP-dependent alcohol dehydrogenase